MAGIFLDNTLMEELNSSVQKEDIMNPTQFFIGFLNTIEGWKTRCKNLHWAAPKKNIHDYLDKFLKILSDYQDSIAEDYQGTLGHMQPNAIKGTQCDCLNALDFIREVSAKTKEFFIKIPEDVDYVGIKSETESFIHNIKVYKYLFELTDVKPY